MKRILSTVAIVAASSAFAQIAISPETSAEAPKATLDVRALNDGTTPDGVLIPRVTESAAESMVTPEISTLAWITEDGTNGTKTGKVDTNGFYYFDGTEWVKLGAAATTESPKTIRVVNAITVAEWDNNQYALVATTNADIELPDPAANKYRIIAVNNQYTNAINYATPAPKNNSTLYAGKGHLLMSDGTDWYVIGGSY